MTRIAAASVALAAVLGCQLPAERTPLKPLPEDSPPVPYSELLTRARSQASAATEAFYVNRWGDVEDAARGLEQTARFLKKASDVPAVQRDRLVTEADALAAEAQKLQAAARNHDADGVNGVMQRLNLKVRELRLDG